MPKEIPSAFSFVLENGTFFRIQKNIGSNFVMSHRSRDENGDLSQFNVQYTPGDLEKLSGILNKFFTYEGSSEGLTALGEAALAAGYKPIMNFKVFDVTQQKLIFETKDPVRLFSNIFHEKQEDEHEYEYIQAWSKSDGRPNLWIPFDPVAWMYANVDPRDVEEFNANAKAPRKRY